jgi:GTPase SAR1 family protein
MVKILFLGDGGVGKTSYISKLVNGDKMDPKYITTTGMNVYHKTILGVDYELVDISGQEFYSINFGTIFDGVDRVFVLYDSSSLLSFKNTKMWISKIPVPFDLIRTKCELPNKTNCTKGTPISTKNNINLLGPFNK